MANRELVTEVVPSTILNRLIVNGTDDSDAVDVADFTKVSFVVKLRDLEPATDVVLSIEETNDDPTGSPVFTTVVAPNLIVNSNAVATANLSAGTFDMDTDGSAGDVELHIGVLWSKRYLRVHLVSGSTTGTIHVSVLSVHEVKEFIDTTVPVLS